MLCGNKDIGFKVVSVCSNCQLYQEGNRFQLTDLIPPGHCFELLHSLWPYMVTFKHGGWFKWERFKDRVVVCCPSVKNNVCAELKKVTENGEITFEYRVLKVNGTCKFYETGKSLPVNKKDFSWLCWDLFNNIFPYLGTGHHPVNITCSKNKEKSQFELFKVEV